MLSYYAPLTSAQVMMLVSAFVTLATLPVPPSPPRETDVG